MRDWKSVPVPQLMLDNCEVDPRGLPVPYVVLKDKDGKHHFKINYTEKTMTCIVGHLCTICGTRMKDEDRWLVGGIASAFDPKGYYLDHPVHYNCGVYALKVCPYLAIRNYNAKIDMIKLQEQLKNEYVLNNPTVDPDRLPFFVIARPESIYYASVGDNIAIVPKRPHLEAEFWDEGQQIEDLDEIKSRLVGTKWEKYLKDITIVN